VLKADPERIDALVYRASADRALDHLEAALTDLDKALSLARIRCRHCSNAAIC